MVLISSKDSVADYVASEMDSLMESKEFRNVFEQPKLAKKGKCPDDCPDDCPACLKTGRKKPKKNKKNKNKKGSEQVILIMKGLSKISAMLDDLGMSKTSNVTLVAMESLVAEAEGKKDEDDKKDKKDKKKKEDEDDKEDDKEEDEDEDENDVDEGDPEDRRLAISTENPEELARLASDKDASVREAVAINENTPSEVLKQLVSDKDASVRKAVAINENTPSEVLMELASDENLDVIIAVAYNKNTPAETLVELARDEFEKVRAAVAYNVNTPVEVLGQLASDENPEVSRTAMLNDSTPLSGPQDENDVDERDPRDYYYDEVLGDGKEGDIPLPGGTNIPSIPEPSKPGKTKVPTHIPKVPSQQPVKIPPESKPSRNNADDKDPRDVYYDEVLGDGKEGDIPLPGGTDIPSIPEPSKPGKTKVPTHIPKVPTHIPKVPSQQPVKTPPESKPQKDRNKADMPSAIDVGLSNESECSGYDGNAAEDSELDEDRLTELLKELEGLEGLEGLEDPKGQPIPSSIKGDNPLFEDEESNDEEFTSLFGETPLEDEDEEDEEDEPKSLHFEASYLPKHPLLRMATKKKSFKITSEEGEGYFPTSPLLREAAKKNKKKDNKWIQKAVKRPGRFAGWSLGKMKKRYNALKNKKKTKPETSEMRALALGIRMKGGDVPGGKKKKGLKGKKV